MNQRNDAENNIFCQIINSCKTQFVVCDLSIDVSKCKGFEMAAKYSRMYNK